MGVKKWVQGVLPVFKETILPGDAVKVKHLLASDGKMDAEIAAGDYIGSVGTVVAFEPEYPFPFQVQFDDGATFCYSLNELELLG